MASAGNTPKTTTLCHLQFLPGGQQNTHSSPAEEMLHLTVSDISGAVIMDNLEISAHNTVADLKGLVSAAEGIAEELLQLVGPDGQKLRGALPLGASLQNGDKLTRIRLQIPEHFDVIGVCDVCGELRHLFYGFNCINLPVIALCSACGGNQERQRDEPNIDAFETEDDDVVNE